MSRRMKRLALLLSVVMTVTSAGSPVLATDYELESDVEQELGGLEITEEVPEDVSIEDTEEEILAEDTIDEEVVSEDGAEEMVLDAPEEVQSDENVTGYAQNAEVNTLALPSEAEIGSIELTLEKNDFAAYVESDFVSGAAITIKDTAGNVLDSGTIEGDEFESDTIDDFWLDFGRDSSWTMDSVMPEGHYPIYAWINSKEYPTNASINIKSLTEMEAPELTESEETTVEGYQSSRYGYNWYQFTPTATGMYQIAPCDTVSIWTIRQDGKPDPVKDMCNEDESRCFYGEAGKTYYIGFNGWVELDDDTWTNTWNVKVSAYKSSNPIKSIKLVTKRSEADRILDFEYDYLAPRIQYITESGAQGECDIYRGTTDDGNGHYFNCYVTDASGQKVNYFAAGTYTVHIEYVDDPTINVSYQLTLTEPDGIALKVGVAQNMRLNGESKWYSFVPEKTGTYVISLNGEISKSEDTTVWLRGGADEEPVGSYDGKTIELERELRAGIRYYFVVLQNDDTVTCNLTLTIRDKDHSYVEETKASTCVSAGYTQRRCSVCGQVEAGSYRGLPMTGHTYGAYVTTKQPTALATGVETRTCAVCGQTDSREIAKLAGTIRLTAGSLPLQIKKSVQLSKVVTDLAAGDYVASYNSSAPAVASVDQAGKVTGKKAGKAEITIQLASGVTAKVKISVQKKAVATSSITTNIGKKWNAKVGEKKQLTIEIKPVSTTDKVTYTSSNKKVATVSGKGLITAKKAGTAKITVKSGKKKYTITVKVAKAAPTGINGVPASKSLKKKKSFTIKAKLVPSGSDAKITYKSSNKKVATVNAKGKVTAKGSGTTVITVKAGNIQRTCTVTVK